MPFSAVNNVQQMTSNVKVVSDLLRCEPDGGLLHGRPMHQPVTPSARGSSL